MKKLLLTIVAFLFVACGGSNPEDIANKFFKGVFEGKVDSVVECFEYNQYTKEVVKGKVSMMVLTASEKAKQYGGFKSVKTKLINKTENNAKAITTSIFKDGTKIDENVSLYNKDGKWFIQM